MHIDISPANDKQSYIQSERIRQSPIDIPGRMYQKSLHMIASEREHLQAAPKRESVRSRLASSSGLTACASATDDVMPLSHATDFIASSKIATLDTHTHSTSPQSKACQVLSQYPGHVQHPIRLNCSSPGKTARRTEERAFGAKT